MPRKPAPIEQIARMTSGTVMRLGRFVNVVLDLVLMRGLPKNVRYISRNM